MFSFGDRRARKGIDIELFVFRILGVEIGVTGDGVSKSFLRDLSRLSWAVFLLFVFAWCCTYARRLRVFAP